MEWRQAKKQLLKKQGLSKAYEKVDLPYEIGKMITDARISKKITQEKLAEMLGTKQPSIARLERGSYLPSFAFLQRIAKAFDTQLLPPRFEFMEESKKTTVYNIQVLSIFRINHQYPAYNQSSGRFYGDVSGGIKEGVASYNLPIRKEEFANATV